jgi:hypothetical protein
VHIRFSSEPDGKTRVDVQDLDTDRVQVFNSDEQAQEYMDSVMAMMEPAARGEALLLPEPPLGSAAQTYGIPQWMPDPEPILKRKSAPGVSGRTRNAGARPVPGTDTGTGTGLDSTSKGEHSSGLQGWAFISLRLAAQYGQKCEAVGFWGSLSHACVR